MKSADIDGTSVSRPPSSIPTARPGCGFSSIELLLVLAITATLSLIALPRFATARDAYHADAAANRLLADLTAARAMARTEDRLVVVKFDPGGDHYVFDNEPDPDRPGKEYAVDLGLAPYNADLVGATFDGANDVAFDRYGAAVSVPGSKALGEPGTITLRSGIASRVIVLDAATGRARRE